MSWFFIPTCIIIIFQLILCNRIYDRCIDYFHFRPGNYVPLLDDSYSLWDCTLVTYFISIIWFIVTIIASYFGNLPNPSSDIIPTWLSFTVQLLLFINIYNYSKPIGYLVAGVVFLFTFIFQVPAYFFDDLIQGKLKYKDCKTKELVNKSLTIFNINIKK